MTNGEKIKAIRKEAGLSAQKFGDKYNIPLRTIQSWELGERQAPEYVIDMLKYIAETEKIAPMAWVFEEYRDKAGIGSTKLFASRYAAVEYAKEYWSHLNEHDQNSYRKDPAGMFYVSLKAVEWDDFAEEFSECGDPIIEAWDALA